MSGNQVQPHLFIVLGATGDLTRRKLLPALYHLFTQGLLSDRRRILGVSTNAEMGDNDFRAQAREALAAAGSSADELMSHWCDERLYYQPIGCGEAEDYRNLAARVAALEEKHHFRYAEAFAPLPEAYETLLLDVLIGDQTLFVRADWVEASWRLYTPLLSQRPPVHSYAAGTEGPSMPHPTTEEGKT